MIRTIRARIHETAVKRVTRMEHLDDCAAWWGGQERKGRTEGGRGKVSAVDIEARGYNLDIRNPHTESADLGDPETLLAELNAAEAEVVSLRDRLKDTLSEALL